jgi:hypothetical protein
MMVRAQLSVTCKEWNNDKERAQSSVITVNQVNNSKHLSTVSEEVIVSLGKQDFPCHFWITEESRSLYDKDSLCY